MKPVVHLLGLLLLLGPVGCGKQSDENSSAPAAKSYTVAVIPKGTTHEFWKSIHAGAVKAERELNEKGIKTEIIWKGPLKEDDRDQQIQVVENFMSRRVSGIVLAPLDSQALVQPVENSIKAQVPVVIIDSGLKSDQYVSFVATDNDKGGQLAGGKVKMVGFDSGSQSVLDLKNGDVQGLVVQNPVLMGYLGVMTMVKHLQGEKVEKRIDTGVVLATPENMEQPEIKELLYPPIAKYLNE